MSFMKDLQENQEAVINELREDAETTPTKSDGKRIFTREFKAKVVKLAKVRGIDRVAKELGIQPGNIYYWRERQKKSPTPKKKKDVKKLSSQKAPAKEIQSKKYETNVVKVIQQQIKEHKDKIGKLEAVLEILQ